MFRLFKAFREGLPFFKPVQTKSQLTDSEGFSQVVISPYLYGFHGVIECAIPGHEDDLQTWIDFLHFRCQFQSAHDREINVHECQEKTALFKKGQGLLGVGADQRPVPFHTQKIRYRLTSGRFVIDYQDFLFDIRHGHMKPVNAKDTREVNPS